MMNVIAVLLYLLTAVVAVVTVYWFFRNIEHAICFCRHNVPFVPSANVLRRAVADEILAHYPDAKTMCDIGGGYGGLARYVARRCGVTVVSLENMLFTAAVACVGDLFCCGRVRTVWCDAFQYLRGDVRFDVAVAYLGPGVNDGLIEYRDKFKVLITLDVPIDGAMPRRVVDVGRGYTKYGRKKYPHKLFVYEF